jgi:hypothetical protein
VLAISVLPKRAVAGKVSGDCLPAVVFRTAIVMPIHIGDVEFEANDLVSYFDLKAIIYE